MDFESNKDICLKCKRVVGDDESGVQCDNQKCERWYHVDCVGVDDDIVSREWHRSDDCEKAHALTKASGKCSKIFLEEDKTLNCLECLRRAHITCVEKDWYCSDCAEDDADVALSCEKCEGAIENEKDGYVCTQCDNWYHTTCMTGSSHCDVCQKTKADVALETARAELIKERQRITVLRDLLNKSVDKGKSQHVQLTALKLEIETLKEAKKASPNRENPDQDLWNDFKEFMSLDGKPEGDGKEKKKNKSIYDDEKKVRGRKFVVNTHQTESRPIRNCFKCNGLNHLMRNCPNFIAMNANDRFNFVIENKICMRCFSKRKHDFTSCERKCSIAGCDGKHHEMLHWVEPDSQKTEDA